eukprot:1400033-Prymnesium_polylepis.1
MGSTPYCGPSSFSTCHDPSHPRLSGWDVEQNSPAVRPRSAKTQWTECWPCAPLGVKTQRVIMPAVRPRASRLSGSIR